MGQKVLRIQSAFVLCLFSAGQVFAWNPYTEFTQASTGKSSAPTFNCVQSVASAANGVDIFEGMFDEPSHTQSVFFGESVEGNHGGSLTRLYRNANQPWASMAKLTAKVTQGDPRFFPAAVGHSVARFFGFLVIPSGLEMWTPDAAEMNGALDKIQRHMEAQGLKGFSQRFYEQTDIGSIGEYVGLYAQKHLIPIYHAQNINRIHDISYHYATFLLEDTSEHSRYIAQQVVDFGLATTRKLQQMANSVEPPLSESDKSALRWNASLLQLPFAIHLDTGSSYLAAGLVARVEYPAESNARSGSPFRTAVAATYLMDVSYSASEGKYPEGSAASALERSMLLGKRASKKTAPKQTVAWEGAITRVLQSEEAKAEFRKFLTSYFVQKQFEDPRFIQAPPLRPDEGCQKVAERMEQLRRAVSELHGQATKLN